GDGMNLQFGAISPRSPAKWMHFKALLRRSITFRQAPPWHPRSMSFVRPRTPSRSNERPHWRALIGLADEHDGAALDRLARSVRLLSQGWPLLVAIRLLLLGQLIGWEQLPGDAAFLFLCALQC